MSHLLDPETLRHDADYRTALAELEALQLTDPGTPAGPRYEELIALMAEYDAQRATPWLLRPFHNHRPDQALLRAP